MPFFNEYSSFLLLVPHSTSHTPYWTFLNNLFSSDQHLLFLQPRLSFLPLSPNFLHLLTPTLQSLKLPTYVITLSACSSLPHLYVNEWVWKCVDDHLGCGINDVHAYSICMLFSLRPAIQPNAVGDETINYNISHCTHRVRASISIRHNCDQLFNCASRNCTKALCWRANIIIWIIHCVLHHPKIFISIQCSPQHIQCFQLFVIPASDVFVDILSGHHSTSPVPLWIDYPCCLVMCENHTSQGQSRQLICHWFSLWPPEICKVMKNK